MSHKSELKYIPGLDALRGFACISVLLFHSNYVTKVISPGVPFQGGFLGVDLFFVLSGFLITTILVNQYARDSTINFKNFYIKRLLRLYPPIIISVIVFLLPLLATNKPVAITNIISLLTYTGDCAMLVLHFTHLPYPLMTGHSWSLAVEEQFYLTFPFLLFLVLRFNSSRKRGNLISFFPAFLLLYFLVVGGSTILLGKWFYKFFFWRFFEVYLGAFMAILYSGSYQKIIAENAVSSRIKNTVHRICANKIVLVLAVVFTLAMVIYPYQVPFFDYMARYNLQYVLFTLSCAILIINAAFVNQPLYSKIISNRVLIFIGKISYGLYLYAPFINDKIGTIFFGGNPFQNKRTMIICDLISGTSSVIFSYLSFMLIEKNILKLKGRLEPKAKPAVISAG